MPSQTGTTPPQFFGKWTSRHFRGMRDRESWALTAVCLATAVGVWSVFYPGLLSPDSVDQLTQATTGHFSNWHPPMLAVLLSWFIHVGLGLPGFMLLQCVAGLLGLRFLVAMLLRRTLPDSVSSRQVHFATGIILLGFLLPISPFPFYLMTFWKDAAVAIGLLWAAILLGNVGVRSDEQQGWGVWWRFGCFLTVAMLVSLMRHNTVVLAPVFGLSFWAIRRPCLPSWLSWLWAFGPVVTVIAAQGAVDRGFRVRQDYVFNMIMAMDLTGMLVVDDRIAPDLPHTASHLTPNYKGAYRFGDDNSLFSEAHPVLPPDFAPNAPDAVLASEYRTALRKHPMVLAHVKARTFIAMLGLDATHKWYSAGGAENSFGIRLNGRFTGIRARWWAVSDRVAHTPMRWISGVHAVWLVAGLTLLWQAKRNLRGTEPIVMFSLISALVYYATYLAAGFWDFRYMYPATLQVQVVAACWLAARILLPRGSKR